MLITSAAGRTWNFSHAIGRNAAMGAGFTQPVAVAVAHDGNLYVLSRGQEGAAGRNQGRDQAHRQGLL